jgi:predicted DNA binding CopG/RHH family protein
MVAMSSFDWDPVKDAENRSKHHVSFEEAQWLSSTPIVSLLVMPRTAVPRSAFTVSAGLPIAERSFASSAPAIGAEAKRSMKRTPRYTDEKLGRVEVVEDFLPPPEQLVLKETGVKVTISLSKRSVDFFKAHAARSRVPYQKMIRNLLDNYADKYAERPLTKRSSGP